LQVFSIVEIPKELKSCATFSLTLARVTERPDSLFDLSQEINTSSAFSPTTTVKEEAAVFGKAPMMSEREGGTAIILPDSSSQEHCSWSISTLTGFISKTKVALNSPFTCFHPAGYG
jgi:hypothetical protein